MNPVQLDTSAGLYTGVSFSATIESSQSTQSVALPSGDVGGGSTLTSTAVTVQNRVETMLASIDPELAADKQLRMLIALLILNAMLENDNGNDRASKAGELGGLASMMGAGQQSNQVAMFSSTNVIQMQHQSTMVYTDQAVQSVSESSGGQSSLGSRMDVCA